LLRIESGPQRLKSLRENSVLEGHGFSRAENGNANPALDGMRRLASRKS
jgi:hypothetical protein